MCFSFGVGILEKSGFFLKKAAVTYIAKNRTLAFVSSASWVAKIIVVKPSICGFVGTEVPTFCYCVIIFSTHFVPDTLPGTNSQQVALSLQKSSCGTTTCFPGKRWIFSRSL